jgi:hypothetical protein
VRYPPPPSPPHTPTRTHTFNALTRSPTRSVLGVFSQLHRCRYPLHTPTRTHTFNALTRSPTRSVLGVFSQLHRCRYAFTYNHYLAHSFTHSLCTGRSFTNLITAGMHLRTTTTLLNHEFTSTQVEPLMILTLTSLVFCRCTSCGRWSRGCTAFQPAAMTGGNLKLFCKFVSFECDHICLTLKLFCTMSQIVS